MLRTPPAGRVARASISFMRESAPALPSMRMAAPVRTPARVSPRRFSPIWKPGSEANCMTLIQGQVVDPQGSPLAQVAVYVISAPVRMPDIAQLTGEQG